MTNLLEPGDVEELERLIEEGCERPGETRDPLGANAEPARPGSPTAWLVVAEHWSRVLNPEDVEELERLIAEGCERPGEIGDPLV